MACCYRVGHLPGVQTLHLTVFGRQESWEQSPDGWPRIPDGEHQRRLNGRPTAQWARTNQPVPQPV